MTAQATLTRLGFRQFMTDDQASHCSLIIVTGREHMLAAQVCDRIVQSLLPDESLRSLNVDTIDALEVDNFSILDEKLAAVPFLAQQRVVVVRNVIELRNEDRIALREAITEHNDQAVLVIDDSGEPKPQRGKAPKDKVHSADFASGQPALLVDCTLDEQERERYIEDYAKTNEMSIDAGARRYLAAFDSVYEIRNALDRLALMGKKISKAAAEEYVKPPGDPKLWDLGNAVGRGDVDAALRLARELVARAEDAPGPLIWLAGDAQIAWELSNGANPNNWAAATGQSPFRAMKLWDFARKRSKKTAFDNVRLTMKALEDSLTGKRFGDQALDEVIIRLCTQKGPP